MAKKLPDIKDLPFEERAAKFQEELQVLVDKWGCAPWAGLQSTNEMIAAVPQIKDLLKKE